MFSNVDDRSYPKTGSEDEGYSSSFRIEFSLENLQTITLPNQ